MTFRLDFTDKAKDQIDFFKKAGDKAILTKMSALFKELSEHPFTGTGKPEPLKYHLSGAWSRRINREHRIYYEANESRVLIHSVKGHYI